MVLFPNCKINLGLNIIRKRADGYHDLETVFYPVAWKDALEIIPSETNDSAQPVAFNTSGITIAGNTDNNLCIKAYTLLKKDFPEMPSISMHLHKVIPMGAGLGGGSSDGAFTLVILNDLFRLGLTEDQLNHYALLLGSDCPFFIKNKPAFASSRGEILEPVELDINAYKFVLIHPGTHVSTAEAFKAITPKTPEISIREIIQNPISTWKEFLTNDFESGITQLLPEIGQIKSILYEKGAIYAAMSGSGSAVYGIFEKNNSVDVHFPTHYAVFQTN